MRKKALETLFTQPAIVSGKISSEKPTTARLAAQHRSLEVNAEHVIPDQQRRRQLHYLLLLRNASRREKTILHKQIDRIYTVNQSEITEMQRQAKKISSNIEKISQSTPQLLNKLLSECGKLTDEVGKIGLLEYLTTLLATPQDSPEITDHACFDQTWENMQSILGEVKISRKKASGVLEHALSWAQKRHYVEYIDARVRNTSKKNPDNTNAHRMNASIANTEM